MYMLIKFEEIHLQIPLVFHPMLKQAIFLYQHLTVNKENMENQNFQDKCR